MEKKLIKCSAQHLWHRSTHWQVRCHAPMSVTSRNPNNAKRNSPDRRTQCIARHWKLGKKTQMKKKYIIGRKREVLQNFLFQSIDMTTLPPAVQTDGCARNGLGETAAVKAAAVSAGAAALPLWWRCCCFMPWLIDEAMLTPASFIDSDVSSLSTCTSIMCRPPCHESKAALTARCRSASV